MKRLIIILAMISLGGCEIIEPYKVDQAFANALEVFKAEAQARGVKRKRPCKSLVIEFRLNEKR